MDLNRRKILFIGIASIVFFITIVITIIVIWLPGISANSKFKYNKYTEEQGLEKAKDIYTKQVAARILNRDVNWLYDKTSSDQKKSENLLKNNFEQYLKKNRYYNFAAEVKAGKYKVYKNGNKNIYEVEFIINNNVQTINIIENSPYDYYISFGNIVYDEPVSKKMVGSNKGIEVELNRKYQDKDGVEYEVTITNKEEQTVEFEFLDVTRIKLKTKEGYMYSLNTDVSSAIDEPLNKDSIIRKDMMFLIPNSEQPNIKYIVFYDTKINGKEEIVEVELQ